MNPNKYIYDRPHLPRPRPEISAKPLLFLFAIIVLLLVSYSCAHDDLQTTPTYHERINKTELERNEKAAMYLIYGKESK